MRAPRHAEIGMGGGDGEAAIGEVAAARTARKAACAGGVERVQRLVEQPQRRLASATTRASAARRRWPADRVRTARCARRVRSKAPGRIEPSSAGGPPRRRSATRRFSRTVRSPLRPSRWPSQASRPRQASGSAARRRPASGSRRRRAAPAGPARATAWSCRCRCGRSAPEARRRPARRTGRRTPAGRRGGRRGRPHSRGHVEERGRHAAPS